tara:strand:- start:1158 stop:1313 length:156 start_codon:yes stop_codon:yes gene_type:complete
MLEVCGGVGTLKIKREALIAITYIKVCCRVVRVVIYFDVYHLAPRIWIVIM